MATNILVLVLLGLFGYLIKKIWGTDPITTVKFAVTYLAILFLVVVPLFPILFGLEDFDYEASAAWTDDYVTSIAKFIENQTPGWVAGYIASTIVGFIVEFIEGSS